jgi:hypothetical protein
MLAANIEDVLDKILPTATPIVVDKLRLYLTLVKSGHHCETETQQKDIPQSTAALETAHFGPFCDQTNAIRQQSRRFRLESQEYVEAKYMD